VAARTGAEYLAGLADDREVWIGGARVRDVAKHPAFCRGAQTIAALYDMQHDSRYRDLLTYDSPSSGERVGTAFMTPHSVADVQQRGRAIKLWADASCGMLGRSPDFLNTNLMAFAANAELFAEGQPWFAENVRRYYEHCRENDLCLTHTLLNPQINRAVGASELPDPYLALGILEQTSDGIILRGARMLATLAPYADELAVFPSTVLKSGPEEERYALAFAVPMATPGLRFICRDAFDSGRSAFDAPLSSRFDEMDAVVVFDDVLVPWDRVFIAGDVELCNNVFRRTNTMPHLIHQFATKNIAKCEFVLGVALLLVETIAVEGFQHVQEKLAEMILYLESMRALVRAAEADTMIGENGVAYPAAMPLAAARNLMPRYYPRMIEILQLLGASGFMATPSEADFEAQVGPELDRYFQAARADARARVRLFRLAWEVAGSGFGSRQVLYERFFSGDPVRNMASLYLSYDKTAAIARVRSLLDSEGSLALDESTRRNLPLSGEAGEGAGG
jgi:4-hydroxyphenylacetate 3-monooxygenase